MGAMHTLTIYSWSAVNTNLLSDTLDVRINTTKRATGLGDGTYLEVEKGGVKHQCHLDTGVALYREGWCPACH